ncbi:MAG: hypothetical protein AAFZ17_01785 [Cyanobacteria bacterium J06650_10]
MLEIIDNFVTNALTLTIYAGPICIGIAFVHFVMTHPMTENRESAAIPETTRSKAVTEKLDEPGAQVTSLLAQVAKISDSSQTSNPEIVCEPINWHVWKVKELRGTALRNIFDIKVRKDGRACRKRELISQYEKAMQCIEVPRLRAVPYKSGVYAL